MWCNSACCLTLKNSPEVIITTEIVGQLQGLKDCGWIDTSAFNTLIDAYTQLSHANQHAALVDDSDEVETSALLNIAQALSDEILG